MPAANQIPKLARFISGAVAAEIIIGVVLTSEMLAHDLFARSASYVQAAGAILMGAVLPVAVALILRAQMNAGKRAAWWICIIGLCVITWQAWRTVFCHGYGGFPIGMMVIGLLNPALLAMMFHPSVKRTWL